MHPDVVRRAVDRTAFDARPGKPHRVCRFVVVAAVDIAGMRRAPELGSPNHQRFLEHASRAKVLDQPRHGLVGHQRVALMALFQLGDTRSRAVVSAEYDPEQVTSTNRTPASTKRRARKHCWL